MGSAFRHSLPRALRRTADGPRIGTAALLLWGLVMAVAMLSFFVHLLNEQALRLQASLTGASVPLTAVPSQAALVAPSATPVPASPVASGR